MIMLTILVSSHTFVIFDHLSSSPAITDDVLQVIFQFPANIVIRKLGAAIWLPSLVIAWGAVTIGQAFTTHWTQLLGCRVLLGVLEAGYFPGCVFLLSCWLVLAPNDPGTALNR